MWGGEIFVDGQVVAEKRRRGRPPVHPRPPLVVAEVPDVACGRVLASPSLGAPDANGG